MTDFTNENENVNNNNSSNKRNSDNGTVKLSNKKTKQSNSGRQLNSVSYSPEENLALITAVVTCKAIDSSNNSDEWKAVELFMDNKGFSRTLSAIYLHFTELRKDYKSSVNKLSKNKGIACPTKTDDEPENQETIKIYLGSLLAQLKETTHAKWWNIDVVLYIFKFTNIGRIVTHETISSDITKTSNERKNKFETDKANRAELIKNAKIAEEAKELAEEVFKTKLSNNSDIATANSTKNSANLEKMATALNSFVSSNTNPAVDGADIKNRMDNLENSFKAFTPTLNKLNRFLDAQGNY